MNQKVEQWLAKFTDKASCPICGYYCLGRGGMECLDTQARLKNERKDEEEASE